MHPWPCKELLFKSDIYYESMPHCILYNFIKVGSTSDRVCTIDQHFHLQVTIDTMYIVLQLSLKLT